MGSQFLRTLALPRAFQRIILSTKNTLKSNTYRKAIKKALPRTFTLSAVPATIYFTPETNQQDQQSITLHNTQPTTFFETLILYVRKILRTTVLAWRFVPLGVWYVLLPVLPASFRELWRDSLVRRLGKCGPCLIKFGQWIATRPDIFPEDLTVPLSELHTRAPAHPFSHTKRSLEEAYSPAKYDKDIFLTLSPEPIASGAVAQVHRGILHDGTDVAVKVKHPRVDSIVSLDLSLLRTAAWSLTKLFRLEDFSLEESIDQFSDVMMAQLDLSKEAHNLIRFRQNFKDFPRVHFPRPLMEHTNTNVLVETFEEGVPVSVYLSHNNKTLSDNQRKSLAYLGVSSFLKMMNVSSPN